jgi:hypothetical protein
LLIVEPHHVATFHSMASLVAAAGTDGPVSLDVQAGNLPGSSQLQDLANGIGKWALVLSLVGLVIGAAAWALGSHSQNFQQTYIGRKAVLVSGLAALLIGAAQPIINFFFNTGQAIKSS